MMMMLACVQAGFSPCPRLAHLPIPDSGLINQWGIISPSSVEASFSIICSSPGSTASYTEIEDIGCKM